MHSPATLRQPRRIHLGALRDGVASAALRRLTRHFTSSPVPFELQLLTGERYTFGTGTPAFRVFVRSRQGLRILCSLDLGRIADAYLSGDFDVEGNLLAMYELRGHLSDFHPLYYLWRFLQPLVFGQVGTNARAIRSHYDLGADFYLGFLGGARCYTQGVFEDPDEPLEVAQRRKFDLCIEACRLQPGSHVLEVGPGWGAFAEHAARRGIQVTAVTNSRQSSEYMTRLGQQLGLPWDVIEADILTHRLPRRYDAVVLMGIMEHLPEYGAVLQRFQALLQPGGCVYLDASAARVKYVASSFIYRRIYPGNHSFFVLHDFLAAVARTSFQIRTISDDRVSYFLTFMHWARNLEANRERLVREFGEWDYRRFHLYLWGSAHCFLKDTLQCYRMVLDYPAECSSSKLLASARSMVSSPSVNEP
ncbi:MAG TPA: class I SAM-dependent methyltransferase [Candidatus Acidoferrales bacterium]|nr:class I SAM-dependent methyltransferase [Candidatus Acidoferrales bacterium]